MGKERGTEKGKEEMKGRESGKGWGKGKVGSERESDEKGVGNEVKKGEGEEKVYIKNCQTPHEYIRIVQSDWTFSR